MQHPADGIERALGELRAWPGQARREGLLRELRSYRVAALAPALLRSLGEGPGGLRAAVELLSDLELHDMDPGSGALEALIAGLLAHSVEHAHLSTVLHGLAAGHPHGVARLVGFYGRTTCYEHAVAAAEALFLLGEEDYMASVVERFQDR